MKIYKLANIVAIPFFILLMALGYLAYQFPWSNYLVWVIFPVSSLILIYLFSPQINYWWLCKHPIKLDQQVINMLNKTNPIYSTLNDERKLEFNNRLALFIEGKDFLAKGMEKDNNEVPYDIRSLISQIPVTMTLNRPDFQWHKFERIVLYKHPFPSPRFKFLHTAETEAEDGVVILSLEHVEKALFQRGLHYDVAWHAYAEAFIKGHPKISYPNLPADIWERIETVSPQSKEQIHGTLGYKAVDALPVLINLYFNYGEKVRNEFPELVKDFDQIFQSKV